MCNDDPQTEKLEYKSAFNSERLCIFDIQTGQDKSIAFMNGIGMRMIWSSAHDYLAFCHLDDEIGKYLLMIYDAINDELYTIDEIIPMATWNFDWSPNGEIIVYTKPLRYDVYVNEEQPLEADIFISNYDGSENKRLTHTMDPEVRVKCLHDSRVIVTEIIRNVDKIDYHVEYMNIILKADGSKWLKK
jgi:Tol biopolymer transport system component